VNKRERKRERERVVECERVVALPYLNLSLMPSLTPSPGPLSIKTIICAALAAAQAAYYLSIAEYSLAVAVDAVAFKARSAAVADTYANQGIPNPNPNPVPNPNTKDSIN
jgi:hypothetical protein